MSDEQVQPVAEETPGLTQWQRVTNTFTAPSKTFEDIKRGNRSWWLPFLITALFGAFLWGTIAKEVTWQGVYENSQRVMPEYAKRMMENMTPEQRAERDRKGPISQEITWALSPLGLLIINVASAGVLLLTINFVFGGKAKFGSILAVTWYAGLVLWPLRLFLAGVALWAGEQAESFNMQNPAPTNIAAIFLSQQDTQPAIYMLLTYLDVLSIWCLVLTAIGIANVACVKRSYGYIAVFGWWAIICLFGIGMTAAFS
jgi:hypothetical protein